MDRCRTSRCSEDISKPLIATPQASTSHASLSPSPHTGLASPPEPSASPPKSPRFSQSFSNGVSCLTDRVLHQRRASETFRRMRSGSTSTGPNPQPDGLSRICQGPQMRLRLCCLPFCLVREGRGRLVAAYIEPQRWQAFQWIGTQECKCSERSSRRSPLPLPLLLPRLRRALHRRSKTRGEPARRQVTPQATCCFRKASKCSK